MSGEKPYLYEVRGRGFCFPCYSEGSSKLNAADQWRPFVTGVSRIFSRAEYCHETRGTEQALITVLDSKHDRGEKTQHGGIVADFLTEIGKLAKRQSSAVTGRIFQEVFRSTDLWLNQVKLPGGLSSQQSSADLIHFFARAPLPGSLYPPIVHKALPKTEEDRTATKEVYHILFDTDVWYVDYVTPSSFPQVASYPRRIEKECVFIVIQLLTVNKCRRPRVIVDRNHLSPG